jgi:hypothetical protein
MPNWCYNTVVISHDDETLIDGLEQELLKEKTQPLTYLRPNPAGAWDYSWSVDNWGTKWDITPHDWDRDGNSITINFDSAWAPPLALYEFLESQGWHINALYHEPGMGFAGRFEDGYDEYYEFDWSDRESIENLPQEILEFSNALEDLIQYEQDRFEEELDELDRTEWYDVSIDPAYIGRYEVTTKIWDAPQYCNWDGKEWSRWGNDRITVNKWRGLATEYETASKARSYEEVVEGWVREYVSTMDEGILRAGNQSGAEPLGVKIIFDGYADLDEENMDREFKYIEGGDHSSMSFAVFVHKDSLNGEEFPEHEQTPWALVHRPKEEVCIWVWYNEKDDTVDVLPFEEGSTELDHELIYTLIDKLDKGEYETKMG